MKNDNRMITNICSILVNGSETERQTIFYVPEERAIYSTFNPFEPIDTPPLHNLGEAVKTCGDLWSTPWSDLQWCDELKEEDIIMTYEEFRKNLSILLSLDKRSIIFTILEMDEPIIGSGMVETSDDLYDFDPFIDAELDRCDEETLYVENCTSYIVGNGEAEHAGYTDVDLLMKCMEKYEDFFDQFIRNECDELAHFSDVEVENADYEEPDDEDSEEDDYEE